MMVFSICQRFYDYRYFLKNYGYGEKRGQQAKCAQWSNAFGLKVTNHNLYVGKLITDLEIQINSAQNI